MDKQQLHKSPAQKKLYSRFKQRISHKPTEYQLSRWEDEGGLSTSEPDESYKATRSMTTRLKKYLEKAWKAISGPPDDGVKKTPVN